MMDKCITYINLKSPNTNKVAWSFNSLKKCHVANIGATPGLTRLMKEVKLDKNVKLLDCPGVVLLRSGENDAFITLRNCKRIEKLDDPIGPVKKILKLCPARLLVSLYTIPSFDSVDDFLQKVATVRGKLKRVVLWMLKLLRESFCMTGIRVKFHITLCHQLGIKGTKQTVVPAMILRQSLILRSLLLLATWNPPHRILHR